MDTRTRLTANDRRARSSSRAVPSALDLALADLTARWDRGEAPTAEEYVGWLDPNRPEDLVELAYREFRLIEDDGLAPDPSAYIARFPALARVFAVREAFDAKRTQSDDDSAVLFPIVGDEIGPYRFIQELGRGGFARVFLAEESDLDDRLVVVKVTARRTPESRLLARARHPHIVELLWHGEAEDGALQIICMPFLGGATLSAILAERRKRGGRPASGRDLLADLDRASAAGYPAPPAVGRPAREVLAGLSYPRAAAWIAARLAEALDHAYSRDVLHGDVKPSNVLLTADGTPMLFDFNLSVDWRPVDADGAPRPSETGGTLAYMAPERLRALAEPETNPIPSLAARHRADIYSLGVVLLELLTGCPPRTPGDGDADDGDRKPRSLRELASAYVVSRSTAVYGPHARPPRAQVATGLRAILKRCLAVDPADRYGRASELVQDLDRWRTDQPLLHALDPVLTTGLSRWARRRRQVLSAVVTGVVVAFVAVYSFHHVDQNVRAQKAVASFEAEFAAHDSPVFQGRRPGLSPRRDEFDRVRAARTTLERAHVLGDGKWREFSEFTDLEPALREDREIFLLEQAYRFAHALGSRPQAVDWQEGLRTLERMEADRFSALHSELARLRSLLNEANPPVRAGSAPPRWMNEYLLGVAAEVPDDVEGLFAAQRHYEAVVAARPDNFWAHYRAAAVAFALADQCPHGADEPISDEILQLYSVAAAHLKAGVDQHPESANLGLHYATCLYYVNRFDESIAQCDKARKLDAQNAETFASLAFLRVPLRQYKEAAQDIDRYDLLSGLVTGNTITKVDPQASHVHRSLGDEFLKVERREEALREYDRAVQLDPNNLVALYGRASQSVYLRLDADADFERLANHPKFEEYLALNRHAVFVYYRAANSRISQGRYDEAIAYADHVYAFSRRTHFQEIESSFVRAIAYAAAAQDDPKRMPLAIAQLKAMYRSAPEDQRGRLQHWYTTNPALGALRVKSGPDALYEVH
jgi:eukaryotic-like serine/threonine-protein kinase